MNQHMYFDDNSSLPSKPFAFTTEMFNQTFTFKSDSGVFSKDEFDFGSQQLLIGLCTCQNIHSLLDFGSGLGIVGIIANKALHIGHVDGVEINPRALALANENAKTNQSDAHFVLSDGFEKVNQKYDCIISNPPIRVGKEKLYAWYRQALNYLNDNGILLLVVRVQQGAKSTINYCETLYSKVEILHKKKGFVVFACYK